MSFRVFPSIFFIIYSSPPLLSPQRLTWSSRCYLQRGKGWWGEGGWRPQICPYLFWAHLKQIRPGCRCLFGSPTLIKGLKSRLFSSRSCLSTILRSCLLSLQQRFPDRHAAFSSQPFHVVKPTLQKYWGWENEHPYTCWDSDFLHITWCWPLTFVNWKSNLFCHTMLALQPYSACKSKSP